ncbi:MAG: tRNA preQ1(34) S-adenosylmethionine ribosyltransferase-isomerase QueA [Candidatus Eisenbacteria bacterium]
MTKPADRSARCGAGGTSPASENTATPREGEDGPGAEEFSRLLDGYDYTLPPEAIAQRPAEPRDASRLLVLRGGGEAFEHGRFHELPRFLRAGDLLVLNDTRVIRARLCGRKIPGGGAAEVFLIRALARGRWESLPGMSGRLRPGQEVDLGEGFRARLIGQIEESRWEVEIETPAAGGPGGFEAFLERAGRIPLPPYIRRPDTADDARWYQTVYARQPGAVAAPTAGLHFTPRLLTELEAAGIDRAVVTLHVGPGTFQPLSPADHARGQLHPEFFDLPPETARAVERARARGGRVIAVGTTSARVLETRARADRSVEPGSGETRLFIRPPRRPAVVDGLITNFHLPRTSLLMLVAALAGRERVLAAYHEALARGYRFYSYGDAMLVL